MGSLPVDPMKSVLKGPLSGPSHREGAGVELAGWSGNASHTFCQSLGRGPGTSASRGGHLGHRELARATCWANLLVAATFPSPQVQGQRRRSPPSSPPLWGLEPGGGGDPQQLTQPGHCLSHSPQDTPWARRRLAGGTRATTQAAAPATLSFLPDHRGHLPGGRRHRPPGNPQRRQKSHLRYGP